MPLVTDFSPFPLSVDAMIGKDSLIVITNLSQLKEKKPEETLSQLRGWVNGRIEIVVVRFYSRIIHRACLTSPLWDQEPHWYPVSGLRLAQLIVRQNNFARTPAQKVSPPAWPRPPLPWSCIMRVLSLTMDLKNIWGPDHLRLRQSGIRKKYIGIKTR